MTTWLPRCFACLLLALPSSAVVAPDNNENECFVAVPPGLPPSTPAGGPRKPDDDKPIEYLVVAPRVVGAGRERVAADNKEIERLVGQLGSDVFTEREAGTTRLKEIGEPALDALQTAAISDDLEVRRRAAVIIAAIEDKLYREPRVIGKAAGIVRVSADGKRMLTGGDGNILRLWDADTGRELRVFEGHTDSVCDAALSPDGTRVLSASNDHSVRLWDAQTGKQLLKYEGHAGAVASVAFGPVGQAISGDCCGRMQLWDLKTGKTAAVFACHTHPRGIDATSEQIGLVVVSTVAYSEGTKLAATSGRNLAISLWNLETGKEVRKLGYSDFAYVCLSPDGKRLAACFNTLVRIWDVETGKVLLAIPATSAVEYPWCVAFSPDGTRIVTGGFDKTMRVWDAKSGLELRKYDGHNGGVASVGFFPDGKRIATIDSESTLRIWRAPR